VQALFRTRGREPGGLVISTVNLAEVLEHSTDYAKDTGIDVPALLDSLGVRVHAPEVETARRVARLRSLGGASLADRFAVATAEVLAGRLHTTDEALAKTVRQARLRVPVTVY